jgi:phosphatidate cytidylyltransferase
MARILSALVLIPMALALVIYSTPPLFLLAIGILGTACLHEYFRLVRAMGAPPQTWYGYASFWILLISLRFSSIPEPAVLSALIMAGFLAALWNSGSMRERVLGFMSTLMGVFYLVFCLYPAIPIRHDFQAGLQWIFILLAVIWAGDTGALAAGRTWGKTPFAPRISPKKTYEGAVGGLLSGVLAAVLLQLFLFKELPLFHVILLSVVLGAFGQLGDLAESMLKRAAGTKDSSRLIPGHGGVLDRVDSLLFALPVLYLYLEWFRP